MTDKRKNESREVEPKELSKSEAEAAAKRFDGAGWTNEGSRICDDSHPYPPPKGRKEFKPFMFLSSNNPRGV
jgi:hypothetical protein